jgi:hypothetical protein
MATFDNNRNYGIEIEFSWNGRCPSLRYHRGENIRSWRTLVRRRATIHTTARTWKIVPDASVNNGGELVSPILNGLDGKEQLRTVLRVIKVTRCEN